MPKELKSDKSRQARSIQRDGIILDAAQEILADSGWRALSLLSTAEAAGVSRKSLHTRFTGKASLAVAVWRERLVDPLLKILEETLSAGGLLSTKASASNFEASLSAAAKPSQELLASVELLIISLFEKELKDEIKRVFSKQVIDWCTPKSGKATKAVCAKRAYVIMLVLGYILASRIPREKDSIKVRVTSSNLFESLQEVRKPETLPNFTFTHLDEEIDFETGDPALEALFNATIKTVGERGFEGASINAISNAAGYTEGLLFSRYKTKLELFLAATHASNVIGLRKNNAAMLKIQQGHPLGIAEAVMMRESLKPGIERGRALHMEQLRVAWAVPDLKETIVKEIEEFIKGAQKERNYWEGDDAFNFIHFSYALGLGLSLLATIDPSAYLLPYSVVTAPMEEHLRRAK